MLINLQLIGIVFGLFCCVIGKETQIQFDTEQFCEWYTWMRMPSLRHIL